MKCLPNLFDFRPTSQCHYTYITKFEPSQEKICQENFEKKCQISFKKQAYNETIRKCYRPVSKVCEGKGPEICQTVFESSCSTKYVELQPGKFGANTDCEKLPLEICGPGCTFEQGTEECHDKVVTSVVETPEEVCDLNPQKTCRFTTKLVPKLEPVEECTVVTKETCQLMFSKPKPSKKPLTTKWCLDESDQGPEETELNLEEARSSNTINKNSLNKFRTTNIQEKDKSNQDPVLNTRKIFLNLDDEILQGNQFENDTAKELLKQNYEAQSDSIITTENPILDVRVGLSTLITSEEKTNGINNFTFSEDFLATNEIGPRRQERNLIRQYDFQTTF